MSRVSWKLPYIHRIFLSNRFIQGKYLNMWLRDSVISPVYLSRSFGIYNGSNFISLTITSDMLGKKFGEFSVTKSLGYRETKKSSKKRASKFKKK